MLGSEIDFFVPLAGCQQYPQQRGNWQPMRADARRQPRNRALFRRIAGVFVPSLGTCFGRRRDGDAARGGTRLGASMKVVGRQSATLKFVLEL